MPAAKGYWERIPFDLDEGNEPRAMPVLPCETEDSIQDRIDVLCEHFGGVCSGMEPTGRLLGRISKVISEDVGRPVVCFAVPPGCKLVGYAVPRIEAKIEIKIEGRLDDIERRHNALVAGLVEGLNSIGTPEAVVQPLPDGRVAVDLETFTSFDNLLDDL